MFNIRRFRDNCAGFTQVKAPVQCGGGGPEASAPVLFSPLTKKKLFFFY